jgi:membrane protease subunit HflK
VSQRIKAAWVAFAIIIVLTGVKFILAAISGSIAVLSEAWHSLADVATTLFVLTAIYRQERKKRHQAGKSGETVPAAAGEAAPIPGVFQRGYRWFSAINTELKISCLIGLVLLAAALAILWRAVAAEPAPVNAPLVTGIIFIVLSFGSFFLYRFEEGMATAVNSAALAADSQHNRADTAISLLTGISLVVYHFGIDIDRWIGLSIAVYIVAFASELLVNTCLAILRNEQEVAFKYRFVAIVWCLFHPATYRRALAWVEQHVQLGKRFRAALGFLPLLWRWTLRTSVVLLLALYCSTMFYTVAPGETALVRRFGKVLEPREGVGPGIHLKLPLPIDRVWRFQTRAVRSLPVGNASNAEIAMIWTKEHGDNRTFISGDNNLFLPYIVVHYRIRDVHQYFITMRETVPEKILAATSYRILNQIFATTAFYDLMIHQRQDWTLRCKELLQRENDALGTGLEIVEFCLKDLHPPIDLAGSYEDVVAAIQLREKYFNDAQRQVHSLLSRERIKAMQTENEAQNYVVEKKKTAEGESRNYLLRFQGYQQGGEVMKDLLFLQAAEKTLSGKKLFLVDPDSGIDDRFIYMENYLIKGKNQ